MSETGVGLASVVDRAIWRREGWNDGNLSFQSTLSRKMLLPAEVVDRARFLQSLSKSVSADECKTSVSTGDNSKAERSKVFNERGRVGVAETSEMSFGKLMR